MANASSALSAPVRSSSSLDLSRSTNGVPTSSCRSYPSRCSVPELTTLIRPPVSMPTSAVVNDASMRWLTSPAVARSAVTSMPVITAYAALPWSSCTMLVFQTIRSFSPDRVSASASRATGTPERLGHMSSASMSPASAGAEPQLPDRAPDEGAGRVAGDLGRRLVDADDDAVQVGDHDDAGRGVEGRAGEPLGDLQGTPRLVLRGDVEELRREQGLVAALGEPGERERHVARAAADQGDLRLPPVALARERLLERLTEVVAELDELEQRGVDELVPVTAEDLDRGLVEVHDP